MTRPSVGEDAKKWGLSYQLVAMYLKMTIVGDETALSVRLEDLHTLLPSIPLPDTETAEIRAHAHQET